MPAKAVEIRQLFAQPWSSDAGDRRCSWMGVKVVCAKVASPSSGCAAMGASAAIFLVCGGDGAATASCSELRAAVACSGSLWQNWVLPAVRCGFSRRKLLTNVR